MAEYGVMRNDGEGGGVKDTGDMKRRKIWWVKIQKGDRDSRSEETGDRRNIKLTVFKYVTY